MPTKDQAGKTFDVVVIGSGPAGCAAAASCAKAGLQVCIVTAASGTADIDALIPVAIESIHPGVTSLLNNLGIAGPEIQASCGGYFGIYSRGNYSPLGEDENGQWKGMHIRREVFDQLLIRKLQASGIEVLFHQTVEDLLLENEKVMGVKTNTNTLLSNYVIDASGRSEVAGKHLKWQRQFFSPPFICWTGVSEVLESFPVDSENAHFISQEKSWTWLAPLPPKHIGWTRLAMKGEKNLDPPGELKNYATIGSIHFSNMRWRLYRPMCSEGILLCGDAAGILDPAAGQGIFNALYSGMEAGNTIHACMQQPGLAGFHLANYDNWFVRQFEMKVEQLKTYYRENGIDWETNI